MLACGAFRGHSDTLLDVSPNPIFRVRIYPIPSLFPGGGKQTKNRFLPSLPPFLCPLILMKPGLLSLCLDLSGARGSHTAKPVAETQ